MSDAELVLSYGHRYGLIGRNGAGKTTLMRTIATYGLPGLHHMKIMLVDQHVEGDEETPLQVSFLNDFCLCISVYAVLEIQHSLTMYVITLRRRKEGGSYLQKYSFNTPFHYIMHYQGVAI